MHVDYDEEGRWLVVARGRLRIAASLGPGAAVLPLGKPGTGPLAASSADVTIDRDTVTMPGAPSPSSRPEQVRCGFWLRAWGLLLRMKGWIGRKAAGPVCPGGVTMQQRVEPTETPDGSLDLTMRYRTMAAGLLLTHEIHTRATTSGWLHRASHNQDGLVESLALAPRFDAGNGSVTPCVAAALSEHTLLEMTSA